MSDENVPLAERSGALAVERTVQVECIEGHYAWVVADQMSACRGCAQKSSCGQATLAGRSKTLRLKVKNTLGLKNGDWVSIGLPSSSLFRSMGLAYGLPLGGFLVGALIGAIYGDLLAMALACMGLVLGLVASRKIVIAGRVSGAEPGVPEMLKQVRPPHVGGVSETLDCKDKS